MFSIREPQQKKVTKKTKKASSKKEVITQEG